MDRKRNVLREHWTWISLPIGLERCHGPRHAVPDHVWILHGDSVEHRKSLAYEQRITII
jgi:hypothetical protein